MSQVPQEGGVHRLRIPHGNGEIELVIQVRTHGDVDLRGQVVPIATGSAEHGVPMVLAPGGRAGKYILEDKVGQGTFGMVFTATDPELDRRVAIKILNPSHQLNSDVLHRFLQEARASARIGHPGIVTVLDCGRVMTTSGETAYIVFELLQGESLATRLQRAGRLSVVNAIEIVRQIAAALDAAHRAGVLHRDLKSENIFLVPDPAVHTGERVKVLDFGLAKLGQSQHTSSGTVFGTPRYMSPEQCRSSSAVDHRSDIYSLGCILFELVTGRTPFLGELRQQIESHLTMQPPRASSLVPGIPSALCALLSQMLSKNPDERPQAMSALCAGLVGENGISPYAMATMLPTPAAVVSPVARSHEPVYARPPAPVVAPTAIPYAPERKSRWGIVLIVLLLMIAAAGAALVASGYFSDTVVASQPGPART